MTAENTDVCGKLLDLKVAALDGDVVLEQLVASSLTAGQLKTLIRTRRPQAFEPWQRLLCGSRQLEDAEVLGPAISELGLGSNSHAVLQLVVAANPWDLLVQRSAEEARNPKDRWLRQVVPTGGPSAELLERQNQAAICANAMGRRQATTLLTRLLEDGEGGELPISAAEDMLFQLKQDLAKCLEPLAALKTAVLDQAMCLLAKEPPPATKSRRLDKLCEVFAWLDALAVPYLVAWLGLQSRPLAVAAQCRAEQLRRHSEFPRVRLAAKLAIDDKGAASLARVEELAKLRASLSRDKARLQAPGDTFALEGLRREAAVRLQELAKTADSRPVCYAVARALRAK